jgi:ADP-ribose pyrophosphatase
MTSWERYVALIEAYPELVEAPADGSGIRILTDPAVVFAEQARLRAAGQEASWTEFGVLSEDPWLYVLRDLVQFPDGRRNGDTRVINRKTLESGSGGICVLPVCYGRIVLLKHYRHAPRQFLWEIPRGFGELGVSPEDNARRELREEVGAEAIRVVPMGWFFVAEIDEPAPNWRIEAAVDGIVDQQRVTPAELRRMILEGEVVDVFTIAAYSLAQLRGLIA